MTPHEMALDLAKRAKAKRLEKGWTQRELAERTGIALPTLKLFEATGQISLERLLKIASALGSLPSFGAVLTPAPATTLEELKSRVKSQRKYGRRR